MGPVLGVVAAVSGVVGAVATVKSARAAKDAGELQARQERVATQRSQRQAIREAQIRRAQTLASSQGFGALDSSGVAGGVSSLSSQLGSTLGFSTEMSGLSQRITKLRTKADTYSALGNLGFTVFNAAGGFNAFSQKGGQTPQGVVP